MYRFLLAPFTPHLIHKYIIHSFCREKAALLICMCRQSDELVHAISTFHNKFLFPNSRVVCWW